MELWELPLPNHYQSGIVRHDFGTVPFAVPCAFSHVILRSPDLPLSFTLSSVIPSHGAWAGQLNSGSSAHPVPTIFLKTRLLTLMKYFGSFLLRSNAN